LLYTDPVADVIAFGVLLNAVLARKISNRTQDNGNKLDHVRGSITDVHKLVNQQLTDSEERRDIAEKENVQLRKDIEQQ
jgi:hypothetical protein